MAGDVALLHWRETELDRPAALLLRFGDDDAASRAFATAGGAHGIIILVSPEGDPGLHLRLLGHLATRAGESDFGHRWRSAPDGDALRATLMREERTLTLRVGDDEEAVEWAGKALRDLDFPRDTLVALVRRTEGAIVPNGETVLRDGDRLTMIGTPEGIEAMVTRLSTPIPPRP